MAREKDVGKTVEDIHNNFFQDLVETSQDLIWQCDSEGRYTYLNPAWETTFGYTIEEMLGKKFSDFQIPEMALRDTEEFKRLMQGNMVKGLETIHIGKSGQEIYLIFNAKFIQNKSGVVIGTRGTAHDITARKRAEENYRMLFREMLDGFSLHEIICDKEGRPVDYRFLDVNPAFERMTGLKASAIIGRTALETISGLENIWIETYGRVALTGDPVLFENYAAGLNKYFQVTAFRPAANQFACIFSDITERKRVEEALRNSESQLNHLFDNSPNAIAFAHKGNYLRVNDAYCRMFGYDKSEIIGSPILRVLAPESIEQVSAIIKKRDQGDKSPFHFETRGLRKNGEVFDLEIESSVCTIDGKDYSIAHHHDITRRKQADELFRKMYDRLSLATQAAQMGIWDWDIQKNVLIWDDRMYALYGIRRDDFNGAYEAWLSGIHPEDRAVSDEISKQALRGERPYDTEFRVIWPDRSVHYIKAFGVVNRDSSGMPVRMIGINYDITERKLTEARLREKDVQFRKLSANVPDLIFQFTRRPDGSYCVPIASEGIRNIFGCEPEDVIEDFTPIAKVIYPDDAERVLRDIEYSAKNLTFFTCEFRVQIPGRPIQWIFSRSAPEKLPDGSITWFGFNADITERKQAEEALRVNKEQSEQQRNQIQKLESLGVLAGGIAHDFNNLMGGIYGYIDMAKEATERANVFSYLSKAMTTMDRARALTAQLLTFAKGGAPIQKVDHLFPFVEETARFALSGANVSCNFNVQNDLWVCNFDRNQMGQVIDNLIINAQQAMPVGGTIELTARNVILLENDHPLLEKGRYIRISVKDSGVGIPKELISRIFDPFFTTKARGHGLGLATCYSIINRHGGSIDVESEQGMGSTFHIYLPATDESVSASNIETIKTHKGSGVFLIMDDEEVMRETIGDMLESLGYTVVSTTNGSEAVDFYNTETQAHRTITGIIFDLTVPGGMGGKAAIEEIRKTDKNIPAFVASGYAEDPVMKNPVEYGFCASICKPFLKSELSELLNRFVLAK